MRVEIRKKAAAQNYRTAVVYPARAAVETAMELELMSEREKVCIITTVHRPFDTRIFHKQARSLAKAGYRVVLLVRGGKEGEVEGVRIVSLPAARSRLHRMLGGGTVLRRALQENASVYHFHDPELLPVGLALKRRGKTVIYDMHEDYHTSILMKKWIPGPLRRPAAGAFRLLESRLLDRLDAVVFAEEYYKELFPGVKARKEDILNYPIIDARALPPPPSSARGGAFNLVYTGNVTASRGIFNMLAALAEVYRRRPESSIHLYVVGYTPPALCEQVDRFIESSGLSGKVTLVGRGCWVDRETIDSYYPSMDAGIALVPPNPHYTQKILTKFFEYMYWRLPVIASDFPLWRDFLEGQGVGRTANPRQPAEAARAVEYLVDHPQEAREMGERGRSLVLERYNWGREERKLWDLYRDLTGNDRATGKDDDVS